MLWGHVCSCMSTCVYRHAYVSMESMARCLLRSSPGENGPKGRDVSSTLQMGFSYMSSPLPRPGGDLKSHHPWGNPSSSCSPPFWRSLLPSSAEATGPGSWEWSLEPHCLGSNPASWSKLVQVELFPGNFLNGVKQWDLGNPLSCWKKPIWTGREGRQAEERRGMCRTARGAPIPALEAHGCCGACSAAPLCELPCILPTYPLWGLTFLNWVSALHWVCPHDLFFSRGLHLYNSTIVHCEANQSLKSPLAPPFLPLP